MKARSDLFAEWYPVSKNPSTLVCLPFITAMSGASGAYHSLVAMRSLDAFTTALNLTSCIAPRGGRLYRNASPPIGSLPVFRLSRSICACSVPHRRCPRLSASACPLQEYSEIPRSASGFPSEKSVSSITNPFSVQAWENGA